MRENIKDIYTKNTFRAGYSSSHLKCTMTGSLLQWPEIYGDGLCRPMDKQEQLQVIIRSFSRHR